VSAAAERTGSSRVPDVWQPNDMPAAPRAPRAACASRTRRCRTMPHSVAGGRRVGAIECLDEPERLGHGVREHDEQVVRADARGAPAQCLRLVEHRLDARVREAAVLQPRAQQCRDCPRRAAPPGPRSIAWRRPRRIRLGAGRRPSPGAVGRAAAGRRRPGLPAGRHSPPGAVMRRPDAGPRRVPAPGRQLHARPSRRCPRRGCRRAGCGATARWRCARPTRERKWASPRLISKRPALTVTRRSRRRRRTRARSGHAGSGRRG
jgi:hypothetical protein